MSFFSSPLDEDLVSRVEQDEDEERIAERAIEANGGVLPKVFPAWSKAARSTLWSVEGHTFSSSCISCLLVATASNSLSNAALRSASCSSSSMLSSF